VTWHVYDHDVGNLLSPGTAPLSFESQQDAEEHLRRLDRGDVSRGRYSIFQAPSRDD
jgi:hypothetical protein